MTNGSTPTREQESALRLLRGGRTYADVAELLGITTETVRSTALAGADALAGDRADSLSESERGRVLDVVLDQRSDDPLLSGSPAAKAYADAVKSSLPGGPPRSKTTTVSTGLPAASSTSADHVRSSPKVESRQPLSKNLATPQTGDRAASGIEAPSVPEGGWQKGSILLGGLAAILIGIVLIAWQPWDDGGSSAKTGTTAPTTTQAARQNAGSGWTVRSRYTLKPVPGASGKAIAGIETKANQAALLIAGAGLPGSSTVGIWFQGPTGSGLVGFQKVDAKGQFTAIGPLPAIVTKANRIIVTRETAPVGSAAPKQPGPVLLTAPFKLV